MNGVVSPQAMNVMSVQTIIVIVISSNLLTHLGGVSKQVSIGIAERDVLKICAYNRAVDIVRIY